MRKKKSSEDNKSLLGVDPEGMNIRTVGKSFISKIRVSSRIKKKKVKRIVKKEIN